MIQNHKDRLIGGHVQGFTLLELLVVSVILALLSVIIAQVFFTTMRTNSKTETVRDVKGNGDRAIDTMNRLIQNAKSVQMPSSCPEYPLVGTTIKKIILTNFDEGVTTLKCVQEVVGGVSIARIASSSATQTVYLMNSNVSVYDPIGSANACTNNALAFTCSSVGTIPSSITIKFTLHQANSAASVVDTSSGSFQTSVIVRNK